MEKVYEVKAKDIEEAKKTAITEYGIDSRFEIIAEEIKKSKNILGFIKSDGVYKITVVDGKKEELQKKLSKLIELMGLDITVDI